MLPYFYSLGMLVTSRHVEKPSPYLSAMDVLAGAIAQEENVQNDPPKIIDFLFREAA